MKTRLPISTISYNTVPFLTLKLKELETAGIIEEWYFIRHLPEDDEGGKKYHNHLWIVPAKSIQTVEIKEMLKEPDPMEPDKPLGCLNFRSSKSFADWYLYGIHDPAYLAAKGESRVHSYKQEDMICSSDIELNRRIHEIDLIEKSPYAKLAAYAEQNLTFRQVFMRGSVPIQQIQPYRQAYALMTQRKTDRGQHEGHEEPEMLIDEETGEIYDETN